MIEYLKKRPLIKSIIFIIIYLVIYILLEEINKKVFIEDFPDLVLVIGISIFGILIPLSYYCFGLWIENKLKLLSRFMKMWLYLYPIIVIILLITYFINPENVQTNRWVY